MLARNDFLDFQFIGAGPREAFWLAQTLAEHPSIALASNPGRARKTGALEFDPGGLTRWRGQFRDAGPLTVLGSIEPELMLDANAAIRLASAFPHLKLVAFLRDPADLLLDLYQLAASRGHVEARLEDELARHPEWLDRARYHRHLLPFLDRFHPDQICLVIYERFFADEVANYQRLCRYLGVDGEFRPSPVIARPGQVESLINHDIRDHAKALASRFLRLGAGSMPQSRVDQETRFRLLDRLDGEMRRLEQTLAIDLDIWRGAAQTERIERRSVENNVVPLPAGAERRQRLAQRRALQEAGL